MKKKQHNKLFIVTVVAYSDIREALKKQTTTLADIQAIINANELRIAKISTERLE